MVQSAPIAAPPPSEHTAAAVSDDERYRAEIYGLLARLLAGAPDAALLRSLPGLSGDDSDLGRAFTALGAAAGAADAAAVKREYHDLFVGLGRGELVPYASYYLTGFLNEKPLARLRATMRELGVERAPTVHEPEDHVAAVLDMMAGLILGRFPTGPAVLQRQRAFFSMHLQSWAGHFFADLERAERAAFYRPVATIGRLLMEIETAAFDMG